MGLSVVADVPSQRDDDEFLLEAMERGDRRAFDAFYKRHARYVAGVVYHLMGRDSELEDAVQETFFDAVRGLSTLREPKYVRRWLATIAARNARLRLSRQRRRRRLGGAVAEVAPRCSDPRDAARAQALYRALDEVDPNLRVPWVLHRIEHRTHDEVAVICEVSVATVKRRIDKAEKALRRRLTDG